MDKGYEYFELFNKLIAIENKDRNHISECEYEPNEEQVQMYELDNEFKDLFFREYLKYLNKIPTQLHKLESWDSLFQKAHQNYLLNHDHQVEEIN